MLYVFLFFSFILSAFTNIYDSQDSRGRKGKANFLTPLYHFRPFHGHLDISRTITAETIC